MKILSQSDIKVIHFSTTHDGGAGFAARRLNAELNIQGLSSIFIAIKRPSYLPSLNEYALRRPLFKSLSSFVTTRLQKNLSRKIDFDIIGVTTLPVKKIIKSVNPASTILHFHNFYNLVTLNQMVKLSRHGFRIMVTLHDQRFFTGGCHHSFDCEMYQSGCAKCPLVSTKLSYLPGLSLKTLSESDRIEISKFLIHCPSNWIASTARKSKILKGNKIVVIPNIYSHELASAACDYYAFYNFNKDKISQKLIVGIANASKESYVKGSDLVNQLILDVVKMKIDVSFLYLADVSKNNVVTDFWQSIDYLLILSRIDNSPNVISEAKIFGIPIIGSNVGGIPELLSENTDYLYEQNTELVKTLTSDFRDRKFNTLDKELAQKRSEAYIEKERDRGQEFLKIYQEF